MAVTYAIDSYKPIAGEFLVSATINKNVWGHTLSKFITSWISADGFIAPIMTNSGLPILWIIGGGVLLWFSERRSTNDSVHKLKVISG